MKNKNTFLQFLKSHWLLIVGLFVGLILPFLILLLVFTCGFQDFSKISDFSAWGSIVAGIATYIGAAVLGVITYYNSWVQDYRKKELDYSIDLLNVVKDGFANFFRKEEIKAEGYHQYEFYSGDLLTDKKYRYKRFVLNNYSRNYPIKIEIYKVEMVGETTIDCTDNIGLYTSFNLEESVDYKSNSEIFLGINVDCLPHWKFNSENDFYDGEFDTIRIIIKVSNKFNFEYLLLTMKENDQDFGTRILTKKEIEKLNFKDISISQTLFEINAQ